MLLEAAEHVAVERLALLGADAPPLPTTHHGALARRRRTVRARRRRRRRAWDASATGGATIRASPSAEAGERRAVLGEGGRARLAEEKRREEEEQRRLEEEEANPGMLGAINRMEKYLSRDVLLQELTSKAMVEKATAGPIYDDDIGMYNSSSLHSEGVGDSSTSTGGGGISHTRGTSTSGSTSAQLKMCLPGNSAETVSQAVPTPTTAVIAATSAMSCSVLEI